MKKGITLVALIVTIIILLILAGITINLVIGENGIISKAQNAGNNYLVSENREQEEIQELANFIENQEFTKVPIIFTYYNPYIPDDFTKIGDEDWNSGFTIKGVEGTANAGDEFVWVPCVLDQTTIREGDNVEIFKNTTTGKYNEQNLTLKETNSTIQEDITAEEIKQSVGQYGGFYIAKYEAGLATDHNSTTSVKLEDGITSKNTDTLIPVSQAGVGVWNHISRINALTVSKNMLGTNRADKVKSTLISGEAWDTTLQWMVNTSSNKETNGNYDINSNNKGQYSNAGGISNRTGVNSNYSVNNIYDMAGNVCEWTSENCIKNGESQAVMRGGFWEYHGSDMPAAFRSSDFENTTSDNRRVPNCTL